MEKVSKGEIRESIKIRERENEVTVYICFSSWRYVISQFVKYNLLVSQLLVFYKRKNMNFNLGTGVLNLVAGISNF